MMMFFNWETCLKEGYAFYWDPWLKGGDYIAMTSIIAWGILLAPRTNTLGLNFEEYPTSLSFVVREWPRPKIIEGAHLATILIASGW